MSVSGFGAEIEKCDEILFVSKATQTAGVDTEEESEVNHLVKAEEDSAHVQITASLSEVGVNLTSVTISNLCKRGHMLYYCKV